MLGAEERRLRRMGQYAASLPPRRRGEKRSKAMAQNLCLQKQGGCLDGGSGMNATSAAHEKAFFFCTRLNFTCTETPIQIKNKM
jgi:hypothetical protein